MSTHTECLPKKDGMWGEHWGGLNNFEKSNVESAYSNVFTFLLCRLSLLRAYLLYDLF